MNKIDFMNSFDFNLKLEGVKKVRLNIPNKYFNIVEFNYKEIELVYEDLINYDLLNKINEMEVEYIKSSTENNEIEIKSEELETIWNDIKLLIYDKNSYQSKYFNGISTDSIIKLNIEQQINNLQSKNCEYEKLIANLIILKFLNNLKQ